ncbi:MAG TPA: glycosyltransferase family 4 protein [Acidimicrobiales bacterium]|nr:glycosyltransferase family 4 protein [Acidimicrobiales bacterium]
MAGRPDRFGILVCLNHLELGGSQLNAIDFATCMAERGHQVACFAPFTGQPGPLAALLQARGIPLEQSKRRKHVPGVSTADVAEIRSVARRHGADLLHAYEFPMFMAAYYGAHLVDGRPLVITVYSMEVPVWAPRTVPLIAGTAELVDACAARRKGPSVLIEPPIDVEADRADAVDGAGWRDEHGFGPDDVVIGIICRLAWYMKADGIERAIRAMELVGGDRAHLVVVGEGEAGDHLRAVAREVNARLGREAVRLPGPLLDPRPAYAGADVMLGMGGSALRSLSFARPLVVLGEQGFSLPFDEQTVDVFLAGGFYGIGAGDPDPGPLAAQIEPLLGDPGRRAALGAMGRRLVLERFSLAAAADRLEAVYRDALRSPVPALPRVREALWSTGYRVAADRLPERAKALLRRGA